MTYPGWPRYTDQLGAVASAERGPTAPTTLPWPNAGGAPDFRMEFFRHDQDVALSIPVQFPHGRRLGSNLGDFHLHLIPMVNPTTPGVDDNVRFDYAYYWLNNFTDAMPDRNLWTTGVKNWTVPAAAQYKMYVVDLFSDIAPPASEGYSSILFITFQRSGTNVGDTFNVNSTLSTQQANLGIASIDAHYLVDRFGSFNEASD